ncbi:MAG: hypothetical protein ACYTAS_19160, partial [Planctomycetota bacterium]
MSQNKHFHGKTTTMYVDAGIRGAKTGTAAKANEAIADGCTALALKLNVPTHIATADWFQDVIKTLAPGAIHFLATNYPHLVPGAIGSHRV